MADKTLGVIEGTSSTMKQYEAVEQAMVNQGGYATLGSLYRTVPQIPGCEWRTKTPFASIRRIVQESDRFFKIRPGLWGLTSQRETILEKLSIVSSPKQNEVDEFGHSYYQGLLVEIGNLKGFQTFVPKQDKNRQFLSHKLYDVATLHEFPAFTYQHLIGRAQTIDVTWFNDRNLPHSFFEVEHSTDIQNSLLKFREFEDFRVRFRIVAHPLRRKEFERKITFAAFTPIRDLVEFWDYDKLSTLHAKVSESVAAETALRG